MPKFMLPFHAKFFVFAGLSRGQEDRVRGFQQPVVFVLLLSGVSAGVLSDTVAPGRRAQCRAAGWELCVYIIGLDGQWAYFALLAASVLVNYGLGLAITRDKPRAKLWLIVGLCYNFLWLFLFKYLNFLLTGVNGVLGWVSGGKAAVPLLGWALPVGISFYTFSAGGYLIDVYRGTVAPERSLLTFGTYLTMFPKLVSGPIASYAQLQPEFGARDVSLRQAVDGLKLFVFGMALKILLANQLGGLWSDVTTIGLRASRRRWRGWPRSRIHSSSILTSGATRSWPSASAGCLASTCRRTSAARTSR